MTNTSDARGRDAPCAHRFLFTSEPEDERPMVRLLGVLWDGAADAPDNVTHANHS